MSRLTRSAHGLDSGTVDGSWKRQAMCAGDPDLWFSVNGDGRLEALHICRRHCPVLGECAAEVRVWIADGNPPKDQVVAACRFNHNGQPVQTSLSPFRCRHCVVSGG